MIVNIQHEYGHIHKPLIVYLYSDNNLFDFPLVEFKIPKGKKIKEIKTKEGGKVIEYLLYGRIISELNIKEVLYIFNMKNFEKSLENYRKDFLNLKDEKVVDVFERESKDNSEIAEIYEEYKQLPIDTKKILEKRMFKSAKRSNDEIIVDLENFYFESKKRDKSHTKFRKDSD